MQSFYGNKNFEQARHVNNVILGNLDELKNILTAMARGSLGCAQISTQLPLNLANRMDEKSKLSAFAILFHLPLMRHMAKLTQGIPEAKKFLFNNKHNLGLFSFLESVLENSSKLEASILPYHFVLGQFLNPGDDHFVNMKLMHHYLVNERKLCLPRIESLRRILPDLKCNERYKAALTLKIESCISEHELKLQSIKKTFAGAINVKWGIFPTDPDKISYEIYGRFGFMSCLYLFLNFQKHYMGLAFAPFQIELESETKGEPYIRLSEQEIISANQVFKKFQNTELENKLKHTLNFYGIRFYQDNQLSTSYDSPENKNEVTLPSRPPVVEAAEDVPQNEVDLIKGVEEERREITELFEAFLLELDSDTKIDITSKRQFVSKLRSFQHTLSHLDKFAEAYQFYEDVRTNYVRLQESSSSKRTPSKLKIKNEKLQDLFTHFTETPLSYLVNHVTGRQAFFLIQALAKDLNVSYKLEKREGSRWHYELKSIPNSMHLHGLDLCMNMGSLVSFRKWLKELGINTSSDDDF